MDAAQRLLCQRLMGVSQTGNTEIGHLHAAVPQHHDVLGLDIPVDDAAAVGVTETTHDLGDKMQRLPPVHMTATLHILFECDPVDELHDDIVNALRTGHIVNRHDIGMAQLCDSQ